MGDITAFMENSQNPFRKIIFKPVICRFGLVVILMHQCISTSIAAQWEIIPRIEISESYDDNVRLAREGQEQDDYITQINPGLSVIGDGRYSDVNIDYQMQNIFYKENDEQDDTNHNLSATSHTEVVKDRVFFDASVNYTQRTIDPEQTSGIDNISITDNRTDAVTYTLSPYVSRAFGQSSELLLRYTYNKIDYKHDSLSTTDSATNTTFLELRSGPIFNRFTWQISHEKQVTEYNERSDVESEDSQLLLRFLFSTKSYLVGQIGYEKYNYNASSGQEDPEGSYWEAGLGWTPSHRTRLEYRQGEHYFGETERIEFSHRSRETQWVANYSEEIITTTRIESQPGNIPVYNEETGESENVGYDVVPTNVPEVYLNKMLSTSVTKTAGKTELTLTLVDSRRVFLEREGDERTSNVTLNWGWQVAGRTRISFDESYTKSRYSSTENIIETKRVGLSVERRVSSNATAYASYDNVKQENNVDGILYRRNYYSIGLVSRF